MRKKRTAKGQSQLEIIGIKYAVRYRDGFRCTECGMSNADHVAVYGSQLQVHRTTPGSLYSMEIGVCVTLCCDCHKTKPKSPRGSNSSQYRRWLIKLPADLHSMLMEYVASQPFPPSPGAVIRKALEEFFTAKGFLPRPEDE